MIERPAHGAPGGRAPARRVALKAALGVVAMLLVILLVALVWKPALAERDGAAPDFAATVLATGIPTAVGQLLLAGNTTLTLREGQIADIAAASLDRNSKTVPAALAAAIRNNVPPIVETVCGCRIDGGAVTLCMRFRKLASFYVTVSGTLSCPGDGTMTFRPSAAKVGIVSIPLRCLAWTGMFRDTVVVSPDQCNVSVTKMTARKGSITVELTAATNR